MDKRHHNAMDEMDEENGKLQSQVISLRKVVDKLINEKGSGAITIEIEEEINHLHQKKRDQGARIEQAMEKIAEMETYIYESQETRTKLGNGDVNSLRQDLSNKIEDLKLRQDQDIAHSNNRIIKIIDEVSVKVDNLDRNVEEIEHRRQNGEKNLLQKSMDIMRGGNIEGDMLDVKRRIQDLEALSIRPKEKQRKMNLENEDVIKEIVRGMADFESELTELKRQISNQDKDVQDAAKLIHELDIEKTRHQEYLSNLTQKTSNLEMLYEVVNKERAENIQNLEELRLATESEFNDVKRAEITDFKNLNGKINEVIVLQDVVEQLADQVDYMQKEIDGVRKIRNHTPIKMENKVASDNLTSSMTPNTILLSDLKNRQTEYTDTTYKTIGRDNLRGRNLIHELTEKRSNPSSTNLRESLLTKSRLSRHLVEEGPERKRDYIQIGNDNMHTDNLPNRLREDSPNDGKPEKRKWQA